MSDKALFVMDIPKDCLHCKMRHVIYCESGKGYQQCGLNRDGYKLESFFKEDDLKDGWISPRCPLKPVPEKKPVVLDALDSFGNGWNACIDEILDELDEK